MLVGVGFTLDELSDLSDQMGLQYAQQVITWLGHTLIGD